MKRRMKGGEWEMEGRAECLLRNCHGDSDCNSWSHCSRYEFHVSRKTYDSY